MSTNTIEINSVWSTFKAAEDQLIVVTGYSKGWYAVTLMDENDNLTDETFKLRAKDFDQQYIMTDDGTWAVKTDDVNANEEIEQEVDADAQTAIDFEAPVEQELTEETKARNPIANYIKRYAEKYTSVKNDDGTRTKLCGDDLSFHLRSYDLETIMTVTGALKGMDMFAKYSHLNNGQKRMNCGNTLRNLLKEGLIDMVGLVNALDAAKG